MPRFAYVLLIASLFAHRAAADTVYQTTANSQTLEAYKLEIFNSDTDTNDYAQPSNEDRYKYFNLPHCQCAREGLGKETKYEYLVTLSGRTGYNYPLNIFSGANCASTPPSVSTTDCRTIGSMGALDNLYPTGSELQLNVYDAVNYERADAGQPCLEREGDGDTWLAANSTGATDTFDIFLDLKPGTDTADTTATSGIDTEAPEYPQGFTAEYSENSVKVSWTIPNSRQQDNYKYQILCAKADGTPAFTAPTSTPVYQRAIDLCGLEGQDHVLDDSLNHPTVSGTSAVDAALEVDAEERVEPDTGDDLAGSDAGSDAAGSDAAGSDAAVDAALEPDAPANIPAGVFNADPDYICGEIDTSTTDSYTIKDLKNFQPYIFGIVSVDLHGNYTGVYYAQTVTPAPVDDFWENLHSDGSNVQGGFCLLNKTYGSDNWITNSLRGFRDDNLGSDSALTRIYYATLGRLGWIADAWIGLRILLAALLLPLVVLALLWHFLTLPGLLGLVVLLWLIRRRALTGRRLSLATAAAAAIVLLMPIAARADPYIPDWQKDASTSREDTSKPDYDSNNDTFAAESTSAKWHAGIRFGPYTPGIDAQLGNGKKPYHQMFGGYNIIPELDVERFLWNNDYYQIGVGLMIGYLSKSAHPFADSADGTPNLDMRVDGATNVFRLIPFAAQASFRFTYLDEGYGIPIVPYVKGGLSYYTWEVSGPNGFARVCSDGMRTDLEPGCKPSNKALGASAGIQGSIGINVRAERIDAAAVRSMRTSGIQHAGFYAEYGFAWVDGFGSSKKLAVGDNTFWLGVDFEF
ncbi:MAG TPA: MXAN_2562 family outer membrane beta-barrel protein [Kofleriaceae bacterium]|jgi:hypothetical protein